MLGLRAWIEGGLDFEARFFRIFIFSIPNPVEPEPRNFALITAISNHRSVISTVGRDLGGRNDSILFGSGLAGLGTRSGTLGVSARVLGTRAGIFGTSFRALGTSNPALGTRTKAFGTSAESLVTRAKALGTRS